MTKDIEYMIINAFNYEPLVVNKITANFLIDTPDFFPLRYYCREWLTKLVEGEIGICNGRRIAVNQKMK